MGVHKYFDNCLKTSQLYRHQFKEKIKCPFCVHPDTFTVRSSFQKHLQDHHYDKKSWVIPNKCTYCYYFTKTEASLQKHILLHKCVDVIERATLKLKCNSNKPKIKVAGNYKKASGSILRASHANVNIKKSFKKLQSEVRSHQCSNCSYWAKKECLLTEHMLQHQHGLIISKLQVKKLKNGIYRCPLCYFYTRNARKHILKHQFGVRRLFKMLKCPSRGCTYAGTYDIAVLKSYLNNTKMVSSTRENSGLNEMEADKFVGISAERCDKTVHIPKENDCQTDISEPEGNRYMLRKREEQATIFHQCPICSYQTSKKNCLKNHMTIHKIVRSTNISKCYLCTKKQKFTENVSKLVRKLPSGKTCFLCSYQTKYSAGLLKHMLSHLDCCRLSDKSKFRCLVCSFISSDLSKFKEHVFEHINGTPVIVYHCDKCEYVTNWQYMLSRHESSHPNVEEKKVAYKDGLLVLRKSKKIPINPWNPLNETPAELEKVEVGEYADLVIVDHKNQTTAENSKEATRESTSGDSLITVLMKQNEEDFVMASENKKINVFECQHCPFFAINDNELTEHMITHLVTEEILKCPACDFKTNRTDFFKQHRLKHIIKYRCPVCSWESIRGVKFSSHLRKHKNFDAGERYNCPYCDYFTNLYDDFKEHVVEHISEDMGSRCLKCFCDFGSKKKLVNHLANHAKVQNRDPFLGAIFDSPLLN